MVLVNVCREKVGLLKILFYSEGVTRHRFEPMFNGVVSGDGFKRKARKKRNVMRSLDILLSRIAPVSSSISFEMQMFAKI